MGKPAIVWFRQDLRLRDNPALTIASMKKRQVVPVFIWEEKGEYPWDLGSASKVWLHYSLQSLAESLKKKGLTLILRKGDPLKVLPALAKEVGAEAVFWNRGYEKMRVKKDKAVEKKLIDKGLQVDTFSAKLLLEPWENLHADGQPFQVFTPFWKAEQHLLQAFKPLPIPRLHGYPKKISSSTIDELKLLPKVKWYKGFPWKAGEEAAWKRLSVFLKNHLSDYEEGRDFPAEKATSLMSPHLSFGEISSRQLWHAVLHAKLRHPEPFLRQIVWRDFAYSFLYFHPDSPTKPLNQSFRNFPWKKNNALLKKWQKGQTGYPIIDAAMRQLWQTGWMHNRLRMIVASFLVKDLLIPWQEGAKWFWDTLVDADLANNSLGWQWVAGCGMDPSPFFRVFNPVLQGEKFDPDGAFVKRYIPEIAKLPEKWIHRPWEAPKEVLAKAGIQLGKDYPSPIVEHSAARDHALETYQKWKKHA